LRCIYQCLPAEHLSVVTAGLHHTPLNDESPQTAGTQYGLILEREIPLAVELDRVGGIRCNSPEQPRPKVTVSFAGSRKSKTGEVGMNIILAVVVCLIVSVGDASAQQPASAKPATEAMCPMQGAHSQMNERGEEGRGFSQSATTHHFFLKPNGGVIQVEANESADAASRDEVRMHLGHVARAFQNGDFDIPMFVHDTVPPGVPEMKRPRKEIRYTFEESASGGRVIISRADKDAVAAIHDFLRFQIEDHNTGDATTVR
jgi:hypothetical protein